MFQIEIDNKNVGQQEENSWFDEELTKKRRKKKGSQAPNDFVWYVRWIGKRIEWDSRRWMKW